MQTITKETLKQDIDRLNDRQFKQIADFITFLKFQSKLSQSKPDLNQFSHLYQEFADEDRELAEIGISEYAESLDHDDKAELSQTQTLNIDIQKLESIMKEIPLSDHAKQKIEILANHEISLDLNFIIEFESKLSSSSCLSRIYRLYSNYYPLSWQEV